MIDSEIPVLLYEKISHSKLCAIEWRKRVKSLLDISSTVDMVQKKVRETLEIKDVPIATALRHW